MAVYDGLKYAHGNDRFVVSMIKWGLPRRIIVSVLHAVTKPNRFDQPSFVPAFELAVYAQGLLGQPADTQLA